MSDQPAAKDSNHYLAGALRTALLVLSALGSLVLLAVTLRYASYGIDLSDEGFYLNSIARPASYPVNVPPSLFGFFWHIPYRLLDGDVAALRYLNVAITFVLSAFLCWSLLRRFIKGIDGPLIALAFSALGLASFRWWLITPNYNSLTFQALMLILIGLGQIDSINRFARTSGWLLIGIGGWIAALTKPTVALAIGLIVVIYVLVWRRDRLLPMVGAALLAAGLVTLSAFLIYGGLDALVARLWRGVEATTLLGSGHDLILILRIDALSISLRQIVIALAVCLTFFAVLRWRWLANPLVLFGLALLPLGAAFIAVTGMDPLLIKPDDLFLLPLALAIAAAIVAGTKTLKTHWPTNLAVAVVLLVLPHIFALGTNNNYWVVASLAGLFWFLSAAVLIAASSSQTEGAGALLPLAAIAPLLTASVLNIGMHAPHRQVFDLRRYDAVLELPGRGQVVTSPAFRDYFAGAARAASAADLVPGTPVVDLSGRSPTLLYVLDVHPLGQAWMVGAYPGSNPVAIAALGLESCTDLARAWLLLEPDGPRHLDEPAILASFGAGAADYELLAAFSTPRNDGDYPDPERQQLLKPLRDPAVAAASCEAARQALPQSQIWRTP